MRIGLNRVKGIDRERPLAVVRTTDFVLEPDGEIDAEDLVRDPRYSLYCFDPAAGTALFVRVDDPAAVDAAPFYYLAQVEQATHAVSLPLPAFYGMAERIPEPPQGVAFVHSVGRCGSTLVSKVLQASPQVHSLSEPDDLTQLAQLRVSGAMDEGEVGRLLQSSVRWRCKPRAGTAASLVAIKTRSQVLVLADLIAAGFRDAKHLFLYRDGLSWMRSNFRGWPPREGGDDPEQLIRMRAIWSTFHPEIASNPEWNGVQIRTFSWVAAMEGYLLLHAAGLETLAARYEDLVECPQTILAGILSFLWLDPLEAATIDEVLGRDSQAGTFFDRQERRHLANEMSEGLVQDVLELIAARPSLRTFDVLVPKTLGCGY